MGFEALKQIRKWIFDVLFTIWIDKILYILGSDGSGYDFSSTERKQPTDNLDSNGEVEQFINDIIRY